MSTSTSQGKLPQELLLCVFIHGFVLPFPRWVRNGVLGRSPSHAPNGQGGAGAQAGEVMEREDKRSRPLPALLPISPLAVVAHFAPPLTPNAQLPLGTPRPGTAKPGTAKTGTVKPGTLPSTSNVSNVSDDVQLAAPNSFKGTDGTFCGFPDRLKHVLHETLPDWKVECVVFPAYETRGELAEATSRFVAWLTELTVNLESSHGLRAGGAKIVLCGHSMGGLVAADALLGVAGIDPGTGREVGGGKGADGGKDEVDGEEEGRVMWPRIIACIGYDTPYLGLHPNVFKNSVSQVTSYVDAAKAVASGLGLFGLGSAAASASSGSGSSTPQPAAQVDRLLAPPSPSPSSQDRQDHKDPPKSPWSKLTLPSLTQISPTYVAAAAGTLLAGAAAGTAYYKRQDLAGGWQWASDHLRYVGVLWDEEGMRRRLEGLGRVGVVFRNFYTHLPPSPPQTYLDRTFSLLPPPTSPFHKYFIPQTNRLAKDEVEAHIGMFEPRSNDGYYEMGLEVVRVVGEAVERVRQREAGRGERAQRTAGAASAGGRTQAGLGEVDAEEVKRKINQAENTEPEATAAGQAAAANLINLDSPPSSPPSSPSSPPHSSASHPSTAQSASTAPTSSLPPTPSSYPASETPISAVPSSAQFSELPWSAKTQASGSSSIGGAGKGWGEKEARRWEGVPVEGVVLSPSPAEGEERGMGGVLGAAGVGGIGGTEEVEVENPWVGRLRRKKK